MNLTLGCFDGGGREGGILFSCSWYLLGCAVGEAAVVAGDILASSDGEEGVLAK